MPAGPSDPPALVPNSVRAVAVSPVADWIPQLQGLCVEDDVNFGDVLTKKKDNILRIGFTNIGGLPTSSLKPKDDLLWQGINAMELDICGLAKLNTDRHLMKEDDRLYSRTQGWWESIHLSFDHNRCILPLEKWQWGGVALIKRKKTVHRVISKGVDPKRLGRWCWRRYRGRNNHTLRIFSCYCPNLPSRPLSTYTQQCSAMLTQGDERCPRIAFVEDLGDDIKQAQLDGDLLVVMVDGNMNMRESPMATMLVAYNLKEAILSKHGINCPATCRRNQSRIPIASGLQMIWASRPAGT